MISDKVELLAARLGHSLHEWAYCTFQATSLGQTALSSSQAVNDLLVDLLLQESSLIWSLWSALGIVPSERPFTILDPKQNAS